MESPLIAVVGPTGSGKSALAMEIARRLNGEIVNCDSLQVYRYFDTGTAKPSADERREIPHHLIDVVNPDEVFTAGDYSRLARAAVADIAARGKLPVVTGGTGFYLRALLDGLFEGPTRDETLRGRLADRELRRPGFLHRLLRRLDLAAAQRIHANDHKKLIRAIEVCIVGQRPLTRMHETGTQPLKGFHVSQFGLDPPRELLYARIDERCRRMFDAGLMDEVKRILAMGYSRTVKPFESLGYKQALALLDGRVTFEEALEEMQRHTRNYAKRQWTWFRRDKRVKWIVGFGGDPETLAKFFELTEQNSPGSVEE